MKASGWVLRPLILVLLSGFGCASRAPRADPIRLWYAQPADASIPDVREGWRNDAEWLKALPVGNGFLGAMVFGDVNRERLQLNEKGVWSGGPDDNDNPDAFASLAEIRRLLFAGKYKEATALTLKTQVCKGAGSGNGNGADVPFGCYQTLGDLWLDFGRSSAYSRLSAGARPRARRHHGLVCPGRDAVPARDLRQQSRPGPCRAPHGRS